MLIVYGKGGKVPIHPLLAWLDVRLTWPGAATQRALFLNRRGGRLSTRAASAIFTAIAQAAVLEGPTTAHPGAGRPAVRRVGPGSGCRRRGWSQRRR
jgi:integrase/recombinase XerC